MKNSWQRSTVIVLCLVLIIYAFASCSNSNNSPESNQNNNNSITTNSNSQSQTNNNKEEENIAEMNANNYKESNEENQKNNSSEEISNPTWDPFEPFEDTVDISYAKKVELNVTIPENDTWEDNQLSRYIKDKLNINVIYDWEATSGESYTQKISMAIASNDLPDVFRANDEQFRRLLENDMILDLDEIYEKTISEDLKNQYKTYKGSALNLCKDAGKLKAFPGTGGLYNNYNLLWLRNDWLDQVELDEPETLDDIIEIATAFIEKDPGKNGENNTIGITMAPSVVAGVNNGLQTFDTVFSYFDSYPKLWIDDGNGNAIYGSITPETKNALAKVQEMYNNGIIDKQFATRKDANEPLLSGKAGMFFGCWWMPYFPLQNEWSKDPLPGWEAYAVPISENGKMNVYVDKPVNDRLVINKNCENPTAVAKILNLEQDIIFFRTGIYEDGYKIYDELIAQGVPWSFFPNGILVIHANQLLEDHNSVKEQLALNEEQRDIESMPANRRDWVENIEKYLQAPNEEAYPYTIYKSYEAEEKLGNTNNLFPVFYGVTETMETNWATLQKLEEEYFLKIIHGEYSIDKFDDFVDEWNKLGGEKIIREVNEIVKRR